MTAQLGRYETLKPIASGGMATVYLARVVGAGGFERLVAVKVMHPHIGADPEFVSMFLDEARLAARVRHPNVVATIDVQSDPLFLVMEYIEGPSLHAVLRDARRKSTRVPMGIALRIVLDVLAGLHAAHDLTDAGGQLLHLVHRDVSPHNVLVGVDGIARITDFGVARAESRLSSTRGGQVKGKIGYMAPEQVRSDPIDRRSDVYAAAIVLWELLTGKPLFQADNEGALVAQVVMGTERPPSSIEPAVPPSIDEAVMRALRTLPSERFATAADFADALEHAAHVGGVALASTRNVAAWVKALAVHDPPGAPSRLAAAIPALPVLPMGSDSIAPEATISSPTRAASVLSAPSATRPRSSLPMIAIAAAIAVAAAALGMTLLARRGGPPPDAPAAQPPAARAPASGPNTATAPSSAASAPPSPSASAAASTSASSSASAAPTIPSTPATPPAVPGGPRPPPRTPPAAPTPQSFRPSDL